jgi:hypothetical protein
MYLGVDDDPARALAGGVPSDRRTAVSRARARSSAVTGVLPALNAEPDAARVPANRTGGAFRATATPRVSGPTRPSVNRGRGPLSPRRSQSTAYRCA